MKSGPIILIDDDEDDKEIFETVIKDIDAPNQLIWFERSTKAFTYLKETTEQPFIIICDINLPVQNGLEFKQQIDGDPELRQKSIPFVFYSTSVQKETVTQVYETLTVQGFFKKKDNYDEIKQQMRLIFDYWKTCRHPNSGVE